MSLLYGNQMYVKNEVYYSILVVVNFMQCTTK